MIKYLFIACLVLASCSTVPETDTSDIDLSQNVILDERQNLTIVRQDITKDVLTIKEASSTIQAQTVTGKEKAPKLSQWDAINKQAKQIDDTSDSIQTNADKLAITETCLANATLQVDKLIVLLNKMDKEVFALKNTIKLDQETIAKLKNDIENYKTGVLRKQQMLWMSIAGIAAIGLIIGVLAAVYVNPKIGGSLALSSIIIASIAYFMACYAWVIAILGGIIVLVIIGYLIHYLIQHKQALTETVKSFEVVKGNSWNTEIKNKVNEIQSDITKKIVTETKATLPVETSVVITPPLK